MTDERRKSIDQIIGLIIATDNEEIQNELWVRVQADKIASLEDRMVCDACGETFEPEDDVDQVFIARRVTGFNCRMKDPASENLVGESEIEWIDEWDDTNRLPRVVEITLWMEPLDEGEEPIELKRIIEIPLAPLSWGRSSSGSVAPPKKSRDSSAPRASGGGSSGGGGGRGSGGLPAPGK